jgi:hypothetical protein
MNAIFRVDGDSVATSPLAAGPWDPSMQHGSPPAALVVWAAEAIPTQVPMRIARVTVDLMRLLPVELPGPDQSRVEPADFSSSPFVTGMSLRAARGRFGVPGPGAIWYRVDRPIVDGSPVSQAMRAIVAADFCNGTSAVLDFRQWTFLNADLTVNFARQPVGEWILLDAESWIGPDGAGLAMARLADARGYFGRAIQSLVIEKR